VAHTTKSDRDGDPLELARRSNVADLRGPVAAYAVRFSPNGKLVAVGDSSGAVVLWTPSASGAPANRLWATAEG
jgi:hypothetical protein